ncbi:MAG: RAQPRD family integrative conjugative element protein [Methylococcaceae bacterium]
MRFKVFISIVLFSLSTFAQADADGERVALAKIVHELEALKPLITEAGSQSNADARIQFEYDWLALDILRIKAGIEEHLAAPRTQPRSFPPLKGDYRH